MEFADAFARLTATFPRVAGGKVLLVGAGPGDPRRLKLHARAAIGEIVAARDQLPGAAAAVAGDAAK